jgi:hypothetical protein
MKLIFKWFNQKYLGDMSAHRQYTSLYEDLCQ